MEQDRNMVFESVRTYVLRSGRMTEAQKRNYGTLYSKWCIPFDGNRRLDFAKLFGNNNPVVVEIGFGMGCATAKIAYENPNVNYLGLEVYRPGVGRLLGAIEEQSLANVRIIERDALDVLGSMICDNSVSGFHIFFADPWPKKRHHKRRLLTRPRTDLMAKKLLANGYLYFVTDWLEYGQWALEELFHTPGLQNKYSGFATPQSWRPSTEFEKKGLSSKREIVEVYFIKATGE